MQVPVNFLAVAGATVAGYIFGALWYGVVFGKLWQRLTGITDMKPAPVNFILVLVGMFVMAYVLDNSIIFGDAYLKTGGIAGGLEGAFFIWMGYVATVTLVTKLYEKKPWGLWLLDNAFWLMTMMIMGVVLSVWP
jgi:hypothetical protein